MYQVASDHSDFDFACSFWPSEHINRHEPVLSITYLVVLLSRIASVPLKLAGEAPSRSRYTQPWQGYFVEVLQTVNNSPSFFPPPYHDTMPTSGCYCMVIV